MRLSDISIRGQDAGELSHRVLSHRGLSNRGLSHRRLSRRGLSHRGLSHRGLSHRGLSLKHRNHHIQPTYIIHEEVDIRCYLTKNSILDLVLEQ